MLKYETKLFDIEVEDKGLNWKRINKTRVPPGDESFNFMCQSYLDSRLISLIDLAGCTEDNKVLKIVERGQGVEQEHRNPFGDQIPQFQVPSENYPFGNLVEPLRVYNPAPGEGKDPNNDPNVDPNMRPSLQTLTHNLYPCNPCTKIVRKMNSPAPRPDPSKFHFRRFETPKTPFSEKYDYFNKNEQDPNNPDNLGNSNKDKNNLSDFSGLPSVPYTTKSGRVTKRLSLSPPGNSGALGTGGMPPPPPPPSDHQQTEAELDKAADTLTLSV